MCFLFLYFERELMKTIPYSPEKKIPFKIPKSLFFGIAKYRTLLRCAESMFFVFTLLPMMYSFFFAFVLELLIILRYEPFDH